MVTLTAPIRLASKTTAALEAKIVALFARRQYGTDVRAVIHGNRARIRLVRAASPRAPKLVGFVHNADSNPVPLLDAAEELLTSGSNGTASGIVRQVRRSLTSTRASAR